MKTGFKQTVLIIILLLFSNSILFAAREGTDLIEISADQPEVDTVVVDQLIDEAKQYLFSDLMKSNELLLEALHISNELDYTKGKAYSHFYLGHIYLDYDFRQAEMHLVESLKFTESIGDSQLLNSINNSFGILYQNIGEYQKAIIYFDELLASFLAQRNDSLAAAIYNNLAISYDELNNDSLALKYYQKAARINQIFRNFDWLARNHQNLGSLFLKQNQLNKAQEHLEKSLALADSTNNSSLKPFIYYNLYELAVDENDLSGAMQYARLTLQKARAQKVIIQEKNALEAIIEMHEKGNRLDSAWSYQKELLVVNDSINQMSRMTKMNELEMQNKLEENRIENELKLKMLEIEKAKKELFYLVLFLLAFIALVILFILFRWQKNRLKHRKKEHDTTIREKGELQNQLDYKSREFTSRLIQQQKQNEFLNEVSLKLRQIAQKSSASLALQIQNIISNLNKNTKKDFWPDFEVRFKEIHGEFYKNLTQQFPGLTPNELKLCAFLKLNLSTKDISELTRQNPDTIKVARYRLRKKLGLARSENIVSFLNQI